MISNSSFKVLRDQVDSIRNSTCQKNSSYSLDTFMARMRLQFEDSSSRNISNMTSLSQTVEKAGINKDDFRSIFSYLPKFIAETMFTTFNTISTQKSLNLTEFTTPFVLLKYGTSDDIAKIIFKLLDLNQTNTISYSNIRTFLTHLLEQDPSYSKLGPDLLEKEIEALLRHFSNKSHQYTYSEYYNIISNESHLLTVIFKSLYQQLHVYTNEYIEGKAGAKSKSTNFSSFNIGTDSNNCSPKGSNEDLIDLTEHKDLKKEGKGRIKSERRPEKVNDSIDKENARNYEIGTIVPQKKKSSSIPKECTGMNSQKKINKEEEDQDSGVFLKPPKKNSKIALNKITANLSVVSKQAQTSTYEGNLWIIYYYENQNKNYLRPTYIVLKNKYLYYYESQASKEQNKRYLKKQNIEEVFVRVNSTTKIKDQLFESFSLYSNQTSVPEVFYHKEKQEAERWVKAIRKENNYVNIFDIYKFVEEISQGGFGKICYSKEINGSQEVAIKVLNKFISGKSFIEEIKNEVDVLKILDGHERIVKHFGYYENSVYSFIVFEYLKNGTLKDLFKLKKSEINESHIKNYAKQIAILIKYLHSKNIVHRDIKLSNVMLTNDSNKNDLDKIKLKLIDFGTCRILDREYTTNHCFGTIEYSAPESFKRGVFDKPNDIWSFGIALFHMLYGYLPFPLLDSNEAEYVKRISKDPITYPNEELTPSKMLERNLIDGCLQKRGHKRLTIQEVLNHPWFQ